MFNLLGRKGRKSPADRPVLNGLVTLHQAYEGILITGGIGSGKTTGPGREAAINLLNTGAGILVLCAKVDECERWRGYCEAAGRLADFVRSAPDEPWHFDFLNYELTSVGGSIESASQLTGDLVDAVSNAMGTSNEPFWPLSAKRQLRHAIAAVWLGTGACSVADVHRFVIDMPNSPEMAADAEWRKGFAFWCLGMAHKRGETIDLTLAVDFVMREWPRLSDKTASSIKAYTMAVLDNFASGSVAPLVTQGEHNLTPEALDQGMVVVIDCPVLRFRDPGRFINLIWKISAQRAVLRRSVTPSLRPVVIWADEAHLFIVPSVDALTQSVGRQSRLISVALTQSIPMVDAQLGGSQRAVQERQSWISNHMTKVMCSNSCKDTNEFFSGMLGMELQWMNSGGSNTQDYDPTKDMFWGAGCQSNTSYSEQYQPAVRPEYFTRLRKGGAPDFTVDAYLFQGGRTFGNGKTWERVSFRQRF